MGEIYIGCGFIRGKLAGIYYDILGQVGGRLAAGRSLLQRHSLHAYPAGAYFSMKKSRQKIFRPSW